MKDKIKEAHRYANWQLFKQSIDKPFIVMHFNANSYPIVIRRWHAVILLVLVLFASSNANAACSYRADAWGNTKYHCDSGTNGTLRTDAWGNTRDTGTGLTYRKDAWGNTRSSDGTTYRTDAWGNLRGSDGTTARKDAWGNTVITNGTQSTTCRTNAWGATTCN